MFRLVIAASCLVVVFSSPLGEEWESYKIRYGKIYMNEKEELYRHSIWAENVEYISKHNKEYELGLHTFTMGMNKYTDMSHKEFVSMMNGYRASNSNISMQSYSPQKNDPLPSSVDWRPKGYVTPVKDQGDCGSCWAFSTTGSLEGQWFKKTGTLISLSEQNLIDCSTENDGCNGGNVALALNYVKENNGIDTEQSYPYEAKQGPCRYNAANRGATCTGYVEITPGDEFTLQYDVATVGPVSVAIDASHDSFQHYSGGVYHEPNCSTTTLDHAVLVVGYDTATTGEEYYIVKNSWNDGWGDKGYIYMPRNSNNYCGIASAAVYPTV